MSLYALDVRRAAALVARDSDDPEAIDLIGRIADCKTTLQPEMDRFSAMCDRFDNLYYPADVLDHAGASHWANDPSAYTPGRAHVSVNSPPVYVDVPASLQSVPPVENMVATGADDMARGMAAMQERLYFAWKSEDDFELKVHQACVVKGLYGRTAGKVMWDATLQRPTIRVVDQPRNLYLGWGNSDYTRLDWALYTYRMTPEAVYEDWGLEVHTEEDPKGQVIPVVSLNDQATRPWLSQQGLEVEVYDYWYRKPKPHIDRAGVYKRVEHETWNCIFVGNVMVKNERHPEYDGQMPFIPLFNTYIPGVPDGRPDLFDIEPLIREKDERMTQGAQMFNKTIDGQMWQLVGPEAPDIVPAGVRPQPNKMIAPGAGNRVEKIEPWMPEFQLEQFLSRIDREMADVSGLNDLLRGLAPAAVLSSSKAIASLVANYEARIRLRRDFLYKWRKDVWRIASTIWSKKMPELAMVFDGTAMLEVTPPSLTPRDDMETAAMASNLVNSKLWSQKRGMDRVGVDDPEVESDIIRSERTDATLFPADVQVMAQLMAVLQQLGMAAPPAATAQAQQQAASLAQQRAAMGGAQGSPMMNAPEEQAQMPNEAMPANTPEGQQLTGPVPGGGDSTLQSQTLVSEGEASNRLVAKSNF